MLIKYRILSINPEEHSLVVRYFTDMMTEKDLASEFNPDGSITLTSNGYPTRCRTDCNLTIYNTNDVSSEAFKTQILNNAPIAFFNLKEKVKDPSIDTSMSSVKKLVGKEDTLEYNDQFLYM